MPVKRFVLGRLGDLDQRLVAEFNRLLDHLAKDCEDRSANAKPRKLGLNVQMYPVIFPDGSLEKVEFAVGISATIPAFTSNPYSMKVCGGQLAFNPDSPYEVAQGTLLPDSDEDAGGKTGEE